MPPATDLKHASELPRWREHWRRLEHHRGPSERIEKSRHGRPAGGAGGPTTGAAQGRYSIGHVETAGAIASVSVQCQSAKPNRVGVAHSQYGNSSR